MIKKQCHTASLWRRLSGSSCGSMICIKYFASSKAGSCSPSASLTFLHQKGEWPGTPTQTRLCPEGSCLSQQVCHGVVGLGIFPLVSAISIFFRWFQPYPHTCRICFNRIHYTPLTTAYYMQLVVFYLSELQYISTLRFWFSYCYLSLALR